MRYIKQLILLAIFCPIFLLGQNNAMVFERDSSFFEYYHHFEDENIDWGFINVPENWDKPSGNKIKLAIAVLRAKDIEKSTNAVVYIPGGPGVGGISEIWGWRNHPLRDNSDIVLVDIRGTGYSEPRLCPELGKKLLEILAKDQTPQEDEMQKADAAYDCKRSLEYKKIDTKAYNSKSIAKDLNVIKKVLNYKHWNVLGVSYGTHIAQVYAQFFPEDFKSLILDSSISDIADYYDKNTSNYMSSLNKVFESCKNNPDCNEKFPDLEKLYYATIEKLKEAPITVKAGKKVVESGEFTYNAEDFKVSLQQALYYKNLIEVMPLLITEFNKGNEKTLSALVEAFSSLLNMDYGLYYCLTCNEAIPANSFNEYTQDVKNNRKLNSGLSFYKSDFDVCKKWGSNAIVDSIQFNSSSFSKPVLVFAGEFDPITPFANGKETKNKFRNAYLVEVASEGHGPSMSKTGGEVLAEFVNNPSQKPKTEYDNSAVNFVTDVTLNEGVSGFANSIKDINPVFIAPLFIALIVLIIAIFFYLISLFQNIPTVNKLYGITIIITSLIGLASIGSLIYGVVNTVPRNFYILAFGLPSGFDYIYILQIVFYALMIFSILFFLVRIKKMAELSLVASVIFSFLVITYYYYYWGFLGNIFS